MENLQQGSVYSAINAHKLYFSKAPSDERFARVFHRHFNVVNAVSQQDISFSMPGRDNDVAAFKL
jgi:hypothetical protein